MWQEAEDFLAQDKYIGPLVKSWGHCTIQFRNERDYFGHIAGNIIGQQLSGKVADVIESRFIKAVGGKVTPESIITTPDQKLRDCGMSWGKVAYVKDLALKTQNGSVQTKRLNSLTDDEVIKELVAVKGIGRWTAEMFLMFSLARPDIFPVDDLGIKKGLRLLRASGSERFEKAKNDKEEKEKMSRFAEKHWKPYRTVASWYLWRSLENR
jgi:DNA-3-methyladenine glycosylase II